jgi:hypothetical protein
MKAIMVPEELPTDKLNLLPEAGAGLITNPFAPVPKKKKKKKGKKK